MKNILKMIIRRLLCRNHRYEMYTKAHGYDNELKQYYATDITYRCVHCKKKVLIKFDKASQVSDLE